MRLAQIRTGRLETDAMIAYPEMAGARRSRKPSTRSGDRQSSTRPVVHRNIYTRSPRITQVRRPIASQGRPRSLSKSAVEYPNTKSRATVAHRTRGLYEPRWARMGRRKDRSRQSQNRERERGLKIALGGLAYGSGMGNLSTRGSNAVEPKDKALS